MQNPIELILIRQWASYLSMPVWIMDREGELLFYNEPAEGILGVRFDEVGRLNAEELAARFTTSDLDGRPIANEELPIVVALTEGVPSHRPLRINAIDGEWRSLAITAFPVVGQSGDLVGAVAMFWEVGE